MLAAIKVWAVWRFADSADSCRDTEFTVRYRQKNMARCCPSASVSFQTRETASSWCSTLISLGYSEEMKTVLILKAPLCNALFLPFLISLRPSCFFPSSDIFSFSLVGSRRSVAVFGASRFLLRRPHALCSLLLFFFPPLSCSLLLKVLFFCGLFHFFICNLSAAAIVDLLDEPQVWICKGVTISVHRVPQKINTQSCPWECTRMLQTKSSSLRSLCPATH